MNSLAALIASPPGWLVPLLAFVGLFTLMIGALAATCLIIGFTIHLLRRITRKVWHPLRVRIELRRQREGTCDGLSARTIAQLVADKLDSERL